MLENSSKRVTPYGRRALAAALALVLCLGLLPASAFANEWQSTCPHDLGQHKVNDAEGGREGPLGGDENCGFTEAVAGSSCTHTHDETCGGLPPAEPSAFTARTAMPMPTMSKNGNYIYANGAALVITAGSSATTTTVYIDSNRNGVVDSGELSLSSAGVEKAPADGADLSDRSIYGGGSTALTGDTKITMNGGKVNRVFGGGITTVTGNSNITINDGMVSSNVYGGGDDGCLVTGTATIHITGGKVRDLYGSDSTLKRGNDIQIHITGGEVANELYGVGGTLTIGENARVGGWSSNGIILNSSSEKRGVDQFTFSAPLKDDLCRIGVCLPSGYDVSTNPIIASGATEADLSKINLNGSGYGKVAYYENGNIRVAEKVPPTGITLTPRSLSLAMGGNPETLTVAFTPGNTNVKKLSWSSTNYNVAKVSGGVVTAVGVGTATITAKSSADSNVTATCTVTVTPPPMIGITVTPYSGTYDGQPHDMVTAVTGAPEGSTITYSTSGSLSDFSSTMPTQTNATTGTSVWVKVTHPDYADFVIQKAVVISKAPLTPTGIGSWNYTREYNGTTAAGSAQITLSGAIANETPTATATIAFDSADVGNNKTVSATGITLGTDAVSKNYKLSSTALSSRSSTAAITPKAVPVRWTMPTLTYTQASLADRVTAKYVDVSNTDVSLTVSFEGAFVNAGTYTATAAMTSVNNNYTLTGNTQSVTIGKAAGSIDPPTQKSVTVTSVTLTAATLSAGDGAITYGYSATNSISTATNWQAGLTFNGLASDTTYYFFAKVADGSNHLAAASGALTVKTNTKSLSGITVTMQPIKREYRAFEAFDKAGMRITAHYDDNTSADIKSYTVSYPDSRAYLLVGDTAVTITYGGKTVTQSVTVTKTTGSGTVTLAGWTYGGAAKNPVPVSSTNGTNNVTYQYKVKGAADGTYSDTVPTNAGDYTVQATFAAVTNYTMATAQADFTIARKPLTEAMLTITGSYTYTGTAITPTYKVTDGSVLTGDDYTAGVTDNTNAGTTKVTIIGKGNYSGSISKTFAIAKAPLTVTVKSPLTISKVYDGNTAVTTAVSDRLEVTGLQNGEIATASGAWTYDNKNVGSSKTVNITGITIAYGTATSSNYTYTQSALTATGAIEQLTLTHDVSVTSTKAYDGTTTAAATGDLTNKITSDVVTLDKAFAFNSKNVSAANQITATTWRINGADKDNYTLPAFAPVTGATITAKPITVAAAASPGVTKVYDGNTSATVDPADYAISGTVSGETLALAGLTATYNAAGVTAANKVTCTGFTLADGSGLAANYNLTTTTFEITASITPKPYTALGFTITGVEPSYAYTNAAITPTPEINCDGTPLVKGADYNLTYADNKAVGKNAKIKIAFTGNYSGNAEKTFTIDYAALPGGTTNTTVFKDYTTTSTTWSSSASGVTFTGNPGWTVGTDGTAFADTITFADEGNTVSKPVYVKNGGDVYISTVTYKLDKTNPKISTAARSAAWSSVDQTITLTASDALSGLAGYGLSKGENQQPTTWQESNVLTVTETGSYWAWAKDKAGNTTHFGQSLDQKIDRNAPEITKVDIPAANARGWHTTAPTVTVSATDTESGGMQYSFDGGQQWQDAHSKTFENGTNLVDIWVQDAVYNIAQQEIFTLKVDTATPAAPTVTGYASGTWTAENVVFTLGNATLTTSGHAKYQVKIGTAGWTDVTGTTVTHSENTVDAGVTYQFRAVNKAGTEGTPSASITVKRRALDAGTVLDNAANKYADADLTHSGTPNPEGWYGTSPITVTVTKKPSITDGGTRYPADTYYKLDNGAVTKLDGSSISVTGDGNHSLVIWTKDAAGNKTTQLTKTIKIDTTAPTITDVTTPSGHWGKENETIHFTAADTTSGVKTIAVKDRAGKIYDVTANTSFVADKNDTYTITVTDHAGEVTTQQVIVTKIDKTAPGIALPTFDDTKWFGATEITATVTDTDGSGVATVTVSGGHFVDATDMKTAGKFTATEPVANAYTYTIAATDNVGNSASKTVTIKIDIRMDGFMAQMAGLDSSSDFSHLAGAKDWYDKQNQIVKNHIDANDFAKEKLENLNTWIEAKAEAAAGALSDKVTNADTLEKIAQAKKDFDSLPKTAQDGVGQATKDALNSKLDDAKKAQNVIDQLENADKGGASYEEKQSAKDAYDKLTEDQKKLIPDGKKPLYDSIKADLAAIDAVLDKLNAVKKPYTPATKELIKTAEDAFNSLTPKQRDAFPTAEKAELDELVTMGDRAQTVETAIKALGDSPALDALQQIKADYNALTADEKPLVDGTLKAAMDKKYQDKLDALTADDKAAAELATRVEEVKKAPTVKNIEWLVKEHDALSDTARGKLTEQTKQDYEKLIDDLVAAKKVIDKLDKIDLGTLTPEHLDEVKDALGKGSADGYDDLTEDQKKLADEVTGGKPDILDKAVTEIADTTEKVEKIPDHASDSKNPDGTPNLGDCENVGNEQPDGTGTGGHDYSDHRKTIEDAKITYEKLSDAGRKLISTAAKDKLNCEYQALMSYLEYVNTAKTATTTVEVAGLAENVQLPTDAATAAKTVVTVEVKDEKPAVMPPIPGGKQETLSVNVKLVASIFNDKNDIAPATQEDVQPKPGEKVLVKLLLPTGFKLETLEIWHVKDSGGRSRIFNFWLVAEADGTYALFEVASFSHFVFFAEKVPVIDGGGTVTPPKPSIPSTEGGNTTITPPQPKPGTSVAVTPKPDEGYEVDKIVVTDQNGKEIPVRDNGDGTYSYIQPKGKVTIKVTYKPVGLPFTDVAANNWFYDSVKYVYEKDLMQGTAADKFSPHLDTDRGMIVTILWRMAGEPETKSGGSFPDVSAGAYYAKAIDWAAENSIVKGYSSGKFGPNDPVTREQLAAILYRYAQFQGLDASAKGDLSKFSEQPSTWAADAMQWAVGADIISGKGNGILDPMGKATRAETAKILANFMALPRQGETAR